MKLEANALPLVGESTISATYLIEMLSPPTIDDEHAAALPPVRLPQMQGGT